MRTIVYGNGKSRQKWNVYQKLDNVVTWGCNRIFNDVKVDNLVAVDYHIQHMIYESGYAHENKCWFANWNILPSNVPYMDITFGLSLQQRKKDKHRSNLPITENDRGERQNVVVNGKLTSPNEGIFVTWVDDDDMVQSIDYPRYCYFDCEYCTFDSRKIYRSCPREWCSGSTALHLACSEGATEVYLMGFDITDDPKDNVYEREQREWHSQSARFSFRLDWARELKAVFNEFENVKFIWAEPISHMDRMIDTLNAGDLNAVINKSMIGQDRLILDNDNLTYDTYENIRRNICR